MSKRRKIVKTTRILGIIALCGYLTVCGFLYFKQNSLLYYPSSVPMNDCNYGEKFSPSKLLRFIRVKADTKKPSNYHIAFFHGNASTACRRGKTIAELFAPLGGVLDLIEYPGFAESGVQPTEKDILAAAEQWVTFVKSESTYEKSKFILVGESLGTGVATYLSTLLDNEGLILFSPYTSISDVGKNMYPLLPVSWIIHDPFQASEWAAHSRAKKVLAFHGVRDTVIPISIGEQQLKNFSIPAELVPYQDLGHNNLVNDNSDLWQRVKAFARN